MHSCLSAFRVLLFFAGFLCLAAATGTADPNSSEELNYVAGDLIIQLDPSKSAASLTGDFQSIDLKPKRLLSGRANIWLYEYVSTNMKSADHQSVLQQVRNHRTVEIAQFNHTNLTLRTTFPDDPGFSNQWGLHNTGQTGGTFDADIDAPEAWDIATGGTTLFGDQIVVAIIDGGCDLNHQDLPFFKNTNEIPNNGIDDDGNGYTDDYDGWDAYANDHTIPSSSHGTHVAGIAAAAGHNGQGVSGVNWGAKVMPIAGSSSQEATVVAAYSYVLEMRSLYNETDGALGAFVVSTNSSFGVDFGNPDNYPIWCAMYDSMGYAGILSAAATANQNIDIDVQGDVPTACASDYLISVTNTTSTDVKNSGAAYGLTTIDLGAPGTGIYSTLPGNGYGNNTGTSMATPHVAGAVALLYAGACPTLLQQYKADPGTVALIMKQYLLDGTDPNASLAGITVTGGRLNVFNAAGLVQNHPCGTTIDHEPLSDTRDTLNDYEVLANVISDTTLVPDSLLLYYEIGSIWYEDTLQPTANPDEYVAYIPAQSPGTQIDYYLYATNVIGDADTSETFAFRVIDYGVTLAPPLDSGRGAVDDTVWYDLTVTNAGVLADEYTLSLSGDQWPTVLLDVAGINVVTTSGVLLKDETFDFKARVVVPSSQYGDVDTAAVRATSTANPVIMTSSQIISSSDGEPLAIPVIEEFPTTTIDIGTWVLASNVAVNDVGLNEPSGPYSLNLNGDPSGADTLMSQAINLRYQTNPIVRYNYQQTGGGDSPESNDDLFVEYFDSSNTWQLLLRHLGADPDMTEFVEVTHALPGNASHNGFRVRFRNTGTAGTFDDWFVDDIYVGLPPQYEMSLSPEFASQYGPAGDTAVYMFTVFNDGINTDNYQLSDSGASWSTMFYDAAGTNPINMTGFVAPGDSAEFTVKVIIPPGAPMNSADLVDIYATSVNEPFVFDQSQINTLSAGLPGGFPWFEPFPDDSLFGPRWITNVGGEVNTEGINPPSAPYVLNLDGGNDTLVTQLIDLDTASGVILSYYYQRGGSGEAPDSTEDLWVEYKNDLGAWVLVNRHLGSGPAMTSFEQVNYQLPANALHSGFQVRLRSAGSCVECDDWYIDDIRVDFAPNIEVSPSFFGETLLQGDSTTGELIIDNVGLGGLDYNLSIIPVTTKSALFTNLLDREQVEPAQRKYPEGFHDYEDIKGTEDHRTGLPVTRDAGGPDGYGYFWIDSDEPGGPTFDWIDVSGAGLDIVADLNDDNFGGPYQIGFNFPYYDTVYNQIYVGSNGIIGFAPDGMGSRFKTTIPTTTTPNNMLAWLWDDLNPDDLDNTDAHVYIDTTGNRCVIQFVDYPEYQAAPGEVITAQVILTADGTITYQYLSIHPDFDVQSCAVGIENENGTIGLEVAYLTPYLKDSLAIQFLAPYQWLTMDNHSGSIAGQGADTIGLKFTTTELDSGTYQTNIIVTSNDPDQSTTIVPASLTVELPPQYICGDINSDAIGPDVADLTYLVDFLFKGGLPPPEPAAADTDGNGVGPDVADLSYLVDYLFKGGPPPICEGL